MPGRAAPGARRGGRPALLPDARRCCGSYMRDCIAAGSSGCAECNLGHDLPGCRKALPRPWTHGSQQRVAPRLMIAIALHLHAKAMLTPTGCEVCAGVRLDGKASFDRHTAR